MPKYIPENKNVKELKEFCKRNNLRGYSTKTKSQLVAQVKSYLKWRKRKRNNTKRKLVGTIVIQDNWKAEYLRVVNEIKRWFITIPKKYQDKLLIFGSVRTPEKFKRSYDARHSKKPSDIDFYLSNYDAEWDVMGQAREMDYEDVIDFGDGIILNTNYLDYENITNDCIDMLYSIVLNDTFLEDLKDISDKDKNMEEIAEELEDKGWKEEDAEMYSSIYPNAKAYQSYFGFTTANILSERFFFPEINLSSESYLSSNDLEDGLSFDKKKAIVIQNIFLGTNFTVYNRGSDKYYNDIFSLSIFIDTSNIEGVPSFEAKDYYVNKDGIILTGETLEIEITELYFELGYDNKISFESAKLEIDGEEITIKRVF